jgi:hypothetical protein
MMVTLDNACDSININVLSCDNKDDDDDDDSSLSSETNHYKCAHVVAREKSDEESDSAHEESEGVCDDGTMMPFNQFLE